MCASDLLQIPRESGEGVGETGQGKGGRPVRVQSQAMIPRVISA